MDDLPNPGLHGVDDKIVGMKKRMYYLVGLILGAVILAVASTPGEGTKIVMCDVGQGEAILIMKGSTQVLIDGGPSSEKILACLEEQVPFYDRSIELIVLTNTDFDHLNGLSSVVERYSVIEFVTADGVHESTSLDKLIGKLSKANIVVKGVERGDVMSIRDERGHKQLEFSVLWPPDLIEENIAIFSDQMNSDKREQILGVSAKRGNLNERSVVLLLLEDNKRILLMGDAGLQAEKTMISAGNLPDADVLKVGHHGSKYASTLEFLQKVRPELAIISVGAKNTYGHPTAETLERLSAVGARVRRTDEEGTISF